jgi:hypothetical protein
LAQKFQLTGWLWPIIWLAMAKDDDLLAEIDRFLEETGMGPTTFGVKAVKNSHLVGRLRRGRDIGMATGKQVRLFMDEHRRVNSREPANEAAE